MQNLEVYIRQQLSQGYSIGQIRQVLIKYGYQPTQINQAIDNVYHPQQTISQQTISRQPRFNRQPSQPSVQMRSQEVSGIPQQHKSLPSRQSVVHHHLVVPHGLIITLILLIIVGGVFFSFSNFLSFDKSSDTLLDFKLEPINIKAQPGEDITFDKEIISMGSKDRFDVVMVHLLKDSEGKVVQRVKETMAVETRSSAKTRLRIDEDILPGKYMLDSVAKYSGQIAEASFSGIIIYLESKTGEATCFDGLKNQDETAIDCGGASCNACPSCPSSCNDFDPCTEDVCSVDTNFNCHYIPIEGCGDIQILDEPSSEVSDEIVTLNSIQVNLNSLIKSNPNEAANLCNTLTDPIEKDSCLYTVAKDSKNSNYCQFISRSTARDPCYFEFIIGFDQLSLCDKIETNYFISSCKSLKIIKETQESIDNQEEQIGDYSFVSAVRTAVNEGKSSQEILAMLGEDNPDINDYNMMDQVIIAVNEGKSDEEIALIILS